MTPPFCSYTESDAFPASLRRLSVCAQTPHTTLRAREKTLRVRHRCADVREPLASRRPAQPDPNAGSVARGTIRKKTP